MQRTDFPEIDPLKAKDRNAQGQGPRTQRAIILHKKKFFAQKNRKFSAKFQAFSKNKKRAKRKKGLRAENCKFFVKFQTKKKNGADLGPFLTNQK